MALCALNFDEIPKSTIFIHPIGIVIRSGTKIGENCTILQNVTIGSRSDDSQPAIIGNNVSIGAGVIILGPVKIGDNVTIGAGCLILDDIPSNCTIVQKRTSTYIH